jgi:hypothetical protein
MLFGAVMKVARNYELQQGRVVELMISSILLKGVCKQHEKLNKNLT